MGTVERMNPKSEEFKAALSQVREQISKSKRSNTRDRMIGYYGCIGVTNDLIKLIEKTEKELQKTGTAYAYAVCGIVMINLAKLASSADDSAGGITNARDWLCECLEKVCNATEYGSDDAEYIYTQSLKDAANKAFDGWDEFALDILQYTARFATAKNIGKLTAFLDETDKKLKAERHYSNWYHDHFDVINLAAMRSIDGDEAAEAFAAAHIDNDKILEIVIKTAVLHGDFEKAERLCKDRLAKDNRLSHWHYLLCDIYKASGDVDSQIGASEQILLLGNDGYYETVKKLMQKSGKWTTERSAFLARLATSIAHEPYMKILAKEKEYALLMEQVRNHPDEINAYTKYLVKDFHDEVCELLTADINRLVEVAYNRMGYKMVAGRIKKLYNLGCTQEALTLLAKTKAGNQNRPAFLDELNTMEWSLR